jgi:hypothetical protein
MIKECPCKKCTSETGRKVGCHGVCKGYIDWKEENDSCNRVRQLEGSTAPHIRRFNY